MRTRDVALTEAQVRALLYLANEAPGGIGSTSASRGMTLSVVRVLEQLGLVRIKMEHTRYVARRPFGDPGAGALRAGRLWFAYITPAGRALADELQR